MKNLSRRQLLLFLILILSIVCAVAGIVLKSVSLLYVEAVLVALGLIVVLRATERGSFRAFRKIEKVQRQLNSGIVKLEEKIDSFSSHASTEHAKADEVESPRRTESHLPSQIESFICEINEYRPTEDGIPLASLVSIDKVVKWMAPTLVLTTEKWCERFRRELKIDTEKWTNLSSDLLDESSVNLVIVDGDSFNLERGLLLSRNYLRHSALLIVEAGCKERVSSISGFKEIAPVGIMYGVRLFYPNAALEPAKYSQLVEYTR